MVRRMDPGNSERVARLFEGHDSTEPPGLVGATRRTLFRYQDLYTHLIEAEQDILPRLLEAGDHPLFQQIDRDLAPLLLPYDVDRPTLLQSRAEVFYSWERP